MDSHNETAASTRSKLTITHMSADLRVGLYSFTYDDGIVEHMSLRNEAELPKVAAFLASLTDEVAAFGRPQPLPPAATDHVGTAE